MSEDANIALEVSRLEAELGVAKAAHVVAEQEWKAISRKRKNKPSEEDKNLLQQRWQQAKANVQKIETDLNKLRQSIKPAATSRQTKRGTAKAKAAQSQGAGTLRTTRSNARAKAAGVVEPQEPVKLQIEQEEPQNGGQQEEFELPPSPLSTVPESDIEEDDGLNQKDDDLQKKDVGEAIEEQPNGAAALTNVRVNSESVPRADKEQHNDLPATYSESEGVFAHGINNKAEQGSAKPAQALAAVGGATGPAPSPDSQVTVNPGGWDRSNVDGEAFKGSAKPAQALAAVGGATGPAPSPDSQVTVNPGGWDRSNVDGGAFKGSAKPAQALAAVGGATGPAPSPDSQVTVNPGGWDRSNVDGEAGRADTMQEKAAGKLPFDRNANVQSVASIIANALHKDFKSDQAAQKPTVADQGPNRPDGSEASQLIPAQKTHTEIQHEKLVSINASRAGLHEQLGVGIVHTKPSRDELQDAQLPMELDTAPSAQQLTENQDLHVRHNDVKNNDDRMDIDLVQGQNNQMLMDVDKALDSADAHMADDSAGVQPRGVSPLNAKLLSLPEEFMNQDLEWPNNLGEAGHSNGAEPVIDPSLVGLAIPSDLSPANNILHQTEEPSQVHDHDTFDLESKDPAAVPEVPVKPEAETTQDGRLGSDGPQRTGLDPFSSEDMDTYRRSFATRDIFADLATVCPAEALSSISQEVRKEIKDIQEDRIIRLKLIDQAEFELCLPERRTMEEIRGALTWIDRELFFVRGLEQRLNGLWDQVDIIRRAAEDRAKARPILERRKALRKRLEALKEEHFKVPPERVPEIRIQISATQKELDDVENIVKLQGLGTTTQVKVKNRPFAKGSSKVAPENKKKDKNELKKEREEHKRMKKEQFQQNLQAALQKDATEDDEDDESVLKGLLGAEDDDRKVMEKFSNMTAEEKASLINVCRKSVKAFVETGRLYNFKPIARAAFMSLQALLPEEALRSKEVAIAIHTTTTLNTKCRYHRRSQKTKNFDGSGKYVVHGVAYAGQYKHSTKDNVDVPNGYMNCGCLIDDVLYDFYFWKTWTVHSTRPNLAHLTDTMKTDVFDPRLRAFIIKCFKESTMLTTDDLYGGYGRPRLAREMDLKLISIQKLVINWASLTKIPISLNYPTVGPGPKLIGPSLTKEGNGDGVAETREGM